MKSVLCVILVFIGFSALSQDQEPVAHVGTFILISGACHEDGCTFTFKNESGEEVYTSSLPESPLVTFTPNEYGGSDVSETCLNKRYVLNYHVRVIYHEESNSSSEELVVTNIGRYIE